MQEILLANKTYFNAACQQFVKKTDESNQYTTARTDAIIALTNLSDNFQQMLAEPQGKVSSHIHQFVIASHTLTSRISALSTEDFNKISPEILTTGQTNVTQMLSDSVENLNSVDNVSTSVADVPSKFHSVNPISIIESLSRDLRNITGKIGQPKE
jgi:hypothetical protein